MKATQLSRLAAVTALTVSAVRGQASVTKFGHSTAINGQYSASLPGQSIDINVWDQITNGQNNQTGGFITLSYCFNTPLTCVSATGSVDPSFFSATGNKLSVNISDVLQLPLVSVTATFQDPVTGNFYPAPVPAGPIPLIATFSEDRSMVIQTKGIQKTSFTFPDGTQTHSTVNTDQVTTRATLSTGGEAGVFALPLAGATLSSASLTSTSSNGVFIEKN
jgi:hypothetical protein